MAGRVLVSFPVTRLISDQFSAEFITFFRSSLAGVIALLMLCSRCVRFPSGQSLLMLLFAGVLITFLFPWLTSLALQRIDASFAGVLAALLPLGTAMAAAYLYHERLSRRFWLCTITASLLLAIFSLSNGQGGVGTGIIWMILALPCASVGYAIGGYLSQSMPAWQVICWMLVLLLPINVPMMMVLFPDSGSSFSATGISALLYLAIFSQLVGFFFWNAGLAEGGIAKISQVQLLQPLMTLLFAQIFVGEWVSFGVYVLSLVILVLIYIGKK